MNPDRLRLDYLSPLPPVRSGIADYSMDLLPRLAELADVRVLALPGQPVAPEVAAAWHPVPAERALVETSGRLPLYHMGNNRYHDPVLKLALEHPGVVVLHDLFLHHVLLDVTLGRGRGREDFDEYRERLTADHGWIGRAAATAKRWNAYGDAPVFELPARRTLLRRQRGVLVHSAWGAAELREEDPDLRVTAVPMGIPLPPAADRRAGLALRARLGLPQEAPLLGSFGFQTPIKRTGAVIAALAREGLERVHLLAVGESARGMDLIADARRAGVADRVHVLGFLPYGDFEAAIAATDLCVNLRYPTAGETSASLLRVLAVGRPVIVSDYAQFADLPRQIALRVPLGDGEVPALASLLRDLLAAPERLQAMGEAAREYVRMRHDPEDAARAVVEACRAFAPLDPLGDDPVVAPRPSSLTWNDFPGTLEVRGAEPPWAPGERRELHVRLKNGGFARWLAGERGPGGLAVVVKLFDGGEGGEDLLAGRTWLALPRDLEPGEEHTWTTEIRRPPGPARLRIEPHLFGGLGFSRLGGPWWERDL